MNSQTMYDTQHYMDGFNEAPKKRGRDEGEEFTTEVSSFSEHRNKRFQSLPLRSSPQSSQSWTRNTNVTPLNAVPGQHLLDEPPSAEVEMTEDMPMHGVEPSQLHLASDVSHATTRMPTPIQPSFAAQVRGQQGEWAGTNPAMTVQNGVNNMGHHQTGFSEDHAVPRTMNGQVDWHSVQNNRRIPSPISECEDGGHTHEVQQGSLPSQSGFDAMSHPNANMVVDHHHPHTEEADSPGPSPERRGHARSKHTINSWTWQPGMKKSFSIGYRADCEKCRLKVPGHFNHIVIS